MKYIQKTGIPGAYSEWCAVVAGTHQADWRLVPSAEKGQLLVSMIEDQGSLCAYTMRRIDEQSSHVEHIKPRSRCRQDLPGSDLDYANLVACYPRKAFCRYGAHRKGGWWDDDGVRFVSPLNPDCEQVFHFGLDGEIQPVDNRADATTTIGVLGLDDSSLTEERKRAIQELIYGANKNEPISRADARRIRDRICDRTFNGTFYPFCVALRGALSAHLERLAALQ